MNWQIVEEWVRVNAARFGVGILAAIAVLVVGLFVARVAASATRAALSRTPLRDRGLLVNFLARTVRVVVVVLAAVTALGQLGVNIGPLIAGIGVTGFVVGFAFKDSLSNLASGLLLLFYQPFEVGDFVEVSGTTGTVIDMSVAATELKMPDGRLAIVPNSKIWNAAIINYNRLGKRRIEWAVGVAYDADLGVTIQALQDVLAAEPRLLPDPAPQIVTTALGESSVDFAVRAWVAPKDFGDVSSDVRRAIKEMLDQRGLEIPFPHRVLVQPKGAG